MIIEVMGLADWKIKTYSKRVIERDIETGKYYREKFNDDNGWNRVEDLDEDEARAYEIVLKYGKYAGTGIRM